MGCGEQTGTRGDVDGTEPINSTGMEQSLPMTLQELSDRQEILDCLLRYCRGVDRFDRELVLSAYHPDAIDDHGTFVGGPLAFVEWAFYYHREHQISQHHMIFNTSIELAGDVAHTETYWQFFGENRVKPNILAIGRYIDRFERRGGRWAIAARVCISECVNQIDEAVIPEGRRTARTAHPSTRDRQDISYQRPLTPRSPT